MEKAMLLTFRPATLANARLIFDWENASREHMRTATPLEWKSHQAWLAASLTNAARLLYIAERDGSAVGLARADLHTEGADAGRYELSYIVAPEARGKGLGAQMMRRFVATILAPNTPIMCEVERGHVPSERIARALGLHLAEETAPGIENGGRRFGIWR